MMTSVWHRSPTIKPNYKRRKGLLPKSSVNQVLLHDNTSQQHLLDLTLSHIHGQERRTRRLLELHRKSFLTAQSLKQQEMRNRGIRHLSLLPDVVAESHCRMAQFSHSGSPHKIKTLPLGKRISQLRNEREKLLAEPAQPNPAEMLQESPSPVPGAGESATLINNIDTKLLPSLYTGGKSFSALPKIKGDITQTFTTHQCSIERAHTFAFNERKQRPKGVRSSLDPRFVRLYAGLVPPDSRTYVDGFVVLSDSGGEVIDRCRPLVLAWQQGQNEKILGKSPECMEDKKKLNLFMPELIDSFTSLQFSTDTDDEEGDTSPLNVCT